MKFFYVDESGIEPYLVFFALQIDAYKLKKATREARPLFQSIHDAYPETLRELKSSKLVNGKSGWRGVDPQIRKKLFVDLCGSVSQMGGSAFCYILDRRRYLEADDAKPSWAETPWLAGATPIALFAQKENQPLKRNKGLSILIFDDNKSELPKLSNFLVDSAEDADEFYERGRKAEPFDHIIDTAFAIQSEHSHLVQISDACAYALRRRAEIAVGGQEKAWEGEHAFFDQAVGAFAARLKFPSKTWVTKPFCDAAKWIRDAGIPDLNKWVAP